MEKESHEEASRDREGHANTRATHLSVSTYVGLEQGNVARIEGLGGLLLLLIVRADGPLVLSQVILTMVPDFSLYLSESCLETSRLYSLRSGEREM